jgi:cell division protein FtsI/penicillin-binding protein 2
MFRAVNASGGTAYDRVTLEDADDAIVLGKAGSAQASRKVLEWLYTCHLPDGTVVEKSAVSAEDLKRQLPGAEITGGRPSVKWPPAEVEDPTHAWFAGYVSSRSSYLQGTNPGGLHVAIVVLMEYGGHGGSAAGPVARDMLQMLVDRQNGRGELE